MRKWMAEDWQFEVTVTDGFSEDCRLGLEKGDKFTFEYGVCGLLSPRDGGDFYMVRGHSMRRGFLRIGDARKNMKWIWRVLVIVSGFI